MKNKKNISLFVACIGYGGTERVVVRFLNELIVHYNVYLIVFYKNIKLPIHEDVNIVCLSNKDLHFSNSKLSKTIDFVKCIFKYQKALRKNNIDVSISFLARPNIINGISKILKPKLATIISERCYPSKTYGRFGKALVNYFYNKNDYLFSNSEHINTDLQNNFNLNIPANVIYNPIYTLDERPNHIAHNNKNETFKIISVGRLNPVKNQKHLIKTMSLLNKGFKLNFYGIGTLEKELMNLSASLNLEDQIYFNGTHKDINSVILDHHCLVLTSLSEGFPNVILEAMSLGVPVIATNCMSGPLELLNDNNEVTIEQGHFVKGKYGLLVNVDDEAGLAEAIKYYQNNEDVRKKYSELSFNKAKEYDIATIGLQLKALIDKSICAE